jgi:hypothetical protein
MQLQYTLNDGGVTNTNPARARDDDTHGSSWLLFKEQQQQEKSFF